MLPTRQPSFVHLAFLLGEGAPNTVKKEARRGLLCAMCTKPPRATGRPFSRKDTIASTRFHGRRKTALQKTKTRQPHHTNTTFPRQNKIKYKWRNKATPSIQYTQPSRGWLVGEWNNPEASASLQQATNSLKQPAAQKAHVATVDEHPRSQLKTQHATQRQCAIFGLPAITRSRSRSGGGCRRSG